jgi:Na+/melibiose symporter-like transporter
MTLRKAGKHVAIAAASIVLGFVTGFIGAVVTWPFWGWFEDVTGIESLGHGGPDNWVFEFMMGLCMVAIFVFLEWIFRTVPARPQPNDRTEGRR